MGRANSSELFSFEAKKCSCSLFSSENSCCQDIHELVVIDDFQVVAPGLAPAIPDLYVLAEVNTPPIETKESVKAIINTCFSKCLRPPIPLFKINCSFVFYDKPYAGQVGPC
jgi:hypothetical protein